ncbi:MAG: hypothetical protein HN368_21650 [Spirochaetales bacterium]|jgi:peptidyl-prolyl cis-trans isomerase D|nr:hypothetical protein [Spirochaetales bacterium]
MPSQEKKRLKLEQKAEQDKTLAAERKRKHPLVYVFSVFLLLIIVVSFVGGPILSRLGGNKPIVFGSYGGEEIDFVSGNYLSRQRDILYDQMQDTSSQSYEWQAYQVWKGAYDRTVIHTAYLQESESSGFFISDNRIDELLLTSGPYMDNGVFSETRYRNTPNSERYRYRSLYREEYTHQQYLQDMIHSGLYSSKEADFLKEMARDERSFSYVLFSYADFPDSEVAAYAEENASLFREIKVSRITVKSSMEDAEAIRQQIVDGIATFEDQAKNFSTDGFAEEGGDMGWREYNSLAPDFIDNAKLESLFSLQKGAISGIAETNFGWVMYRVDEAAVEADLNEEETLRSVRTYMGRFERGKIEDYLFQNAERFSLIAAASTFEAAAADVGVSVKTTESFPINYGNEFFFGSVQTTDEAQDLSNAAYDENFFSVLFSLEEGDTSEPLVLSDNVGVFQLKESSALLDEDLGFLGDYYPFIAQQYIEQDLNSFILSSDQFEDNFTSVFSEIFLSQ